MFNKLRTFTFTQPGPTEPSNPDTGDTWLNTNTRDFKIFNGVKWIPEVEESTPSTNIENISWANETFNVSSQQGSSADIAFNPNGDKLYVSGYGVNKISMYNLSTPWDVSTATFSNVEMSISTTYTMGLTFSSDGMYIYIVDYSNKSIARYSLTTAWDISTSTGQDQSVLLSAYYNYMFGVQWNDDGTILYVAGNDTKKLTQYTVSVAWDLTANLSFTGEYTPTLPDTTLFYDILFMNSGNKLIALDYQQSRLYQYSLGTAWDITSAVYDNFYQQFDILEEDDENNTHGIFTNNIKLWMIGPAKDTVFTYNL